MTLHYIGLGIGSVDKKGVEKLYEDMKSARQELAAHAAHAGRDLYVITDYLLETLYLRTLYVRCNRVCCYFRQIPDKNCYCGRPLKTSEIVDYF